MEVTYPVNVIVDNVKVGEGAIKLIDEFRDDTVQRIVSRSVSGSVLVDSVVVGSASGSYEDYVTYGSGGTRTVDILVRTFIDSVLLSSSTLMHTDRYGAVVTEVPPPQPQPYPKLWLILLPLGLLFIIFARRRKEEEKE
ncbi:MAG: hypothetical protein QXT64_02740 [Desulfurococcaceae archaeon]